MVLSAHELYAIEKMAVAGMGIKKIGTTLGLPQYPTPANPAELRTILTRVYHRT